MHALGVLVVLPTALSDETGTDLPTYKIGCNTMNRFDCNAACTDAGWTMLCIQNAQQNNFIWNSVTKTGVDTWLGYSDKKIEGTWEWVNGCQSTYTNWGGDEPNSYGGDEDYAVLCPTYYSSVKGWCDWGMGTDKHLCVCQTDEANPADFVFPQIQNCNNDEDDGDDGSITSVLLDATQDLYKNFKSTVVYRVITHWMGKTADAVGL